MQGLRRERVRRSQIVGDLVTRAAWLVLALVLGCAPQGAGSTAGDAGGLGPGPPGTDGTGLLALPSLAAPATLHLGSWDVTPTTDCPSSSLLTNRCFRVTISGCDGVAPISALVKVSNPNDAIAGTVVFGTGSAGTSWYEASPVARDVLMRPLVDAGYRVVQRRWEGDGWLPGTDGSGVAARACSYATLLTYLERELGGGAFCATAHSAGSMELAYSLTRYGRATLLDQVVFTGGPAVVRLDYGCMRPEDSGWQCIPAAGCTAVPCTLGPGAALFDLTYQRAGGPPVTACVDRDASWQVRWREDSALSPHATTAFPRTRIRLVNGEEDCLNGVVAQANEFAASVQADFHHTMLAGIGHGVPSSRAGAAQILAYLLEGCVK